MATFKRIASTTLGSATSIVTFSSLPNSSSYNDLFIIICAGDSRATTPPYKFNGEMKFNNSSTAVYDSQTGGFSDGSLELTRNLQTGTLQYFYNISGANANRTVMTAYLPDYSRTASPANPKLVIYDVATSANTTSYPLRTMASGLFNDSSAISTIQIYANGDGWRSGSVFTIYGIKRA